MPTNRCRSRDEPGSGSAISRTRAGVMLLAGTFSAASVLADTPSTGPEDKRASSEKVAADSSKATVGAGSSTAKGTARGGATSSSVVAAQRVALTTGLTSTHSTLKPNLSTLSKPAAPSASIAEEPPTARALRLITACQSRFESVTDYICTFYKRERINGRLTPLYVMAMKARTKPKSIYFKFADPYKGREAIFVEGQNGGKILAHDVGFSKFLAGTLELEPSSSRAMEDNRHPITEAGIGALIDTVARRWAAELSSDESVIVFDSDMTIGPRHCQLIESIHTRRQPDFQFYKVRLFIDSELNLPIRFEGYDWPREPGAPADLAEEYSYIDLKLNVGLGDIDFDACNRQYSFGRF
ncbi:MAG: DUF1571 domain-containing protein [Isosphaeraceae bacterium]